MQTQARQIVLTSADRDRLRELIAQSRNTSAEGYEYLAALGREVDNAKIVPPREIPGDVVTMNSTVRVRVDGQKRSTTFTIVYPEAADMEEGRISVLAPLGTALLGYRVGDEVEWEVPAGRRRYHIVKIDYQPEAAGEFES